MFFFELSHDKITSTVESFFSFYVWSSNTLSVENSARAKGPDQAERFENLIISVKFLGFQTFLISAWSIRSRPFTKAFIFQPCFDTVYKGRMQNGFCNASRFTNQQ